MRGKLVFVLALALLLSGCRMQLVNRLLHAGGSGSPLGTQTPPTVIASPTLSPTNTPVPAPTATLTPTPDPVAVGLPAETSGTSAFDFVSALCQAEWFTRTGDLPCPGDPNKSSGGFVISLPSSDQNLPSGYPVLLMYPPQDTSETIFSKYPALKVQKGDRFRAVLACRAHTFCDVEFLLDAYTGGSKTGVMHWPYRFTDTPIVIDYPLDGVAGLTVQFGLSLRGAADRLDSYGVWILPHIYRPSS